VPKRKPIRRECISSLAEFLKTRKLKKKEGKTANSNKEGA
jgi:hypothetical protein